MIVVEKITIKEILNRPVFKNARLIAGKKGIHREVKWVHILEKTSPSSFSNSNDLILTTGLAFLQNKSERKKYMLELCENNVSGLCIEMVEHLKKIPPEVLEICNQYNLPLIVFETSIRFVDITQDIHSLLINNQNQTLKNLEDFSKKLQQTTLQTSNTLPILKLLNEFSSHQIIYYSTVDKSLCQPFLSSKTMENLLLLYKKSIQEDPEHITQIKLLTINESTFFLSQPVICLGETLAYIAIILHTKKENEFHYLLLDYAGKSLAQILLRKLFLESKTQENQQHFIENILYNKVQSENETLLKLGFQTKEKYLWIAGIIHIQYDHTEGEQEEHESANQDLLILLRYLFKKNGIYSLLMLRENQFFVICAQKEISGASKLNMQNLVKNIIIQFKTASKRIQVTHMINLYFGFSQTKESLTELHRGFNEALITIEVSQSLSAANTSPFYDDLGIYKFIKEIEDHRIIHSFINFYIGKVIEYDKVNNTNLLFTLHVYLKFLGAKQETANALFIHRQTLYTRLDKLFEILGSNFLKPENRLSIEIAIHCYYLVNQTDHSNTSPQIKKAKNKSLPFP